MNILEMAQNRVVPMIGQASTKERTALDRAVRRGEIEKWRGYWFPVAGAPFGIGPLKTCYGPIGSQECWAAFHLKASPTR
jgi:hypothetical protein